MHLRTWAFSSICPTLESRAFALQVTVASIRPLRTISAFGIVAAGLLLAACTGGDEPAQAAPVQSPAAQTAPTPTPTPVPETIIATPTPFAGPNLTRSEVEGLVLMEVSSCATLSNQAGAEGTVRLFFDSEFDGETRSWVVESTTADASITFGIWRVDERLRSATPDDATARGVASSRSQCATPIVLFDSEPTPPRFVPITADGAPVEGEDTNDLITSAELAAVRVWSGVYSCSQDFPELASFTARPDVGGVWLVEGRTPVTSYGLWEVEASSGAVTPRDDRASQVSASCDASPVALTGEQAKVRVWVATYDCFVSAPTLGSFTFAQESPHRWVVEGRGDQVLYGLWLVDTDSGRITGLDQSARTIRAKPCFQTFL